MVEEETWSADQRVLQTTSKGLVWQDDRNLIAEKGSFTSEGGQDQW